MHKAADGWGTLHPLAERVPGPVRLKWRLRCGGRSLVNRMGFVLSRP